MAPPAADHDDEQQQPMETHKSALPLPVFVHIQTETSSLMKINLTQQVLTRFNWLMVKKPKMTKLNIKTIHLLSDKPDTRCHQIPSVELYHERLKKSTLCCQQIRWRVSVRVLNVCEGSAGRRLLAPNMKVGSSHAVAVWQPAVCQLAETWRLFRNKGIKDEPPPPICTLGQLEVT